MFYQISTQETFFELPYWDFLAMQMQREGGFGTWVISGGPSNFFEWVWPNQPPPWLCHCHCRECFSVYVYIKLKYWSFYHQCVSTWLRNLCTTFKGPWTKIKIFYEKKLVLQNYAQVLKYQTWQFQSSEFHSRKFSKRR